MRQNDIWQQMTQDVTWHHVLIFKQKLLEDLKYFFVFLYSIWNTYLIYKQNSNSREEAST